MLRGTHPVLPWRAPAPFLTTCAVRCPHQAGAAVAWNREPVRPGDRNGAGKAAGIQPGHRYENQTRGIDPDGLGKLAETLGGPMAYLVAEDDDTADAILALSQLSPEDRAALVRRLKKRAAE